MTEVELWWTTRGRLAASSFRRRQNASGKIMGEPPLPALATKLPLVLCTYFLAFIFFYFNFTARFRIGVLHIALLDLLLLTYWTCLPSCRLGKPSAGLIFSFTCTYLSISAWKTCLHTILMLPTIFSDFGDFSLPLYFMYTPCPLLVRLKRRPSSPT